MDTIPDQLRALLQKAYAPYSRYPVAAIIRTPNGRLFFGVNVENAAYPMSRCAEQVAVGAMVAGGERRIAEVWVMGLNAPTPCGGCRQVLSEFAGPEVAVHCLAQDGQEQVYRMADLLPFAFRPEDLAEATKTADGP
ncbi:Cytidine deaminase [Calidithermus terrae]|uniref:Cytidine deaminase n=1 Tax=Calidithermus terrae TaxID=1408545 RepID=A0A399ETC7_9DEIN|nr:MULTISPECIES: cytidine deaminase [Calidithermus]RIH86329.1 Cytidine deaminase [Calidithermus terrae]